MLRRATAADRDAVVGLSQAEEIEWFGEPEYSREETVEILEWFGGLESGVVVEDGGRIRGAALISGDLDTLLVADPADPDPPFDVLVDWLVGAGASWLSAYVGDTRRIDWLTRQGWAHTRSSFDMLRAGAGPVEAPRFPEGVDVVVFDRDADATTVHRLVYVDAAWADVPGHTARALETWLSTIALSDRRAYVAWRGDRPVGWIVGRVLDDGRAWVQQVAVVRDERGRGLGRALLLHTYGVLLADGATGLGLDVSARNRAALELYRSIGLEVTREWRFYERARGG